MSSTHQAEGGGGGITGFDQNVIVMRHGDRRDLIDPSWVATAGRPWDPPLIDAGRIRAYRTGLELRYHLVFPIHRVFVSPFLRCVQTASEVVSALCAVSDDAGSENVPGGSVHIDPSKVKVSIEFGLCETLNRGAIRPELVPKDGVFHFNITELEAMLPSGTIDHAAEMIYQEIPRWEEIALDTKSRYDRVIQALADKYPSENLLLVSHGECIRSWSSTLMKGAETYDIPNYCSYVHARRRVTLGEREPFDAGSFELLTVPDQTGVRYHPAGSLSDAV